MNPAFDPIYGRLKRPSDGARWNGTIWNELGASALASYSLTLTPNANFSDEVFCDRPGGISAEEEVVLEVLLGDGASPTAADPLVCAQGQGPGVEDVLDQLGEIATDLGEDLITWDVDVRRDETQDEYTIVGRRNTLPLTSGITGTPQIQVLKRDGTDLVAATNLTAIATGRYKLDEADDRITPGEGYIARITATVDGDAQTWEVPFGRDSG